MVWVDAIAPQGVDGDAVFAPFVRADQAQQAAQRDHPALAIRGAPGFAAGGLHAGGAMQGDVVGAVDFDQQLTQHARAQGLRLSVGNEGRARVHGRLWGSAALASGGIVQTRRHALQQLARLGVAAAPEQTGARTGQAMGLGRVEVGADLHPRGQTRPVVGLPKRLSGLAVF